MKVQVEGAELYYSTRGEGPTCLVLCGFGTALGDWMASTG